MELTFIGYAQLVIGSLIVLAGSLRAAFLFLLLSGLFEGSAAIILTSLGGSTIPPIQFALAFVVVRILIPRGGFLGSVREAFHANRWLAAFVIYGVASAYLGPRLFAGEIDVPPMYFLSTSGLFHTVPLAPNNQNITASVYFIGTLTLAMVAWIACRFRGGAETLVSATILIGWLFIATGLIGIAVRGTPLDAVLDVFRNGNYSQLDNDLNGFVRIRGLMPEASTYAGVVYAWFVLNTELWYRSIRPRSSGAVALVLGLVLLFSTSSTAYVALAGYGLFLAARPIVLPGVGEVSKNRKLLLLGGFGVFVIAVALATVPQLPQALYDMIATMTYGKSDSDSGKQRLFWALSGWRAFVESYGLGIGPGSFRSSSMFMAIVGSTGVIGVISFLAYVVSMLQPWRRSTWGSSDNLAHALGGACATAALLGLIPSLVAAPQAYPNSSFAIFAGAALALRYDPARRQRRRSESAPPMANEPTGEAAPA
jgi:hypothetical protein